MTLAEDILWSSCTSLTVKSVQESFILYHQDLSWNRLFRESGQVRVRKRIQFFRISYSGKSMPVLWTQREHFECLSLLDIWQCLLFSWLQLRYLEWNEIFLTHKHKIHTLCAFALGRTFFRFSGQCFRKMFISFQFIILKDVFFTFGSLSITV